MTKCTECGGMGYVIVYRPNEPCFVCDGKGRVLDFVVPTFVLERTGRVVHRIDKDGEAWRYTLDRARREVVRIKRGNYLGYSRELSAVKARPNCIVRVYLK